MSASTKPWASATFQGSRHEVVLHFTGDGAEMCASSMVDQAPAAEFSIAGHIVADIGFDGHKLACDHDEHVYALFCLSTLIVGDW
jgi:hypothetical protein